MIPTRANRTGSRFIALLVLGFVALLAAWIIATPPFAAPDEASHYLRALSLANGHLLGRRVPYPPVRGLTRTQLAFVDHDTRAVLVPARLAPPDVMCLNGKPDLSGRCLEATPNGNFPPLGYLLPAVALKVAHHSVNALWLSRVASALPCLVFLLLAVGLLWSGTGWSLLGLLAASTPAVLFISSVMNSGGLQIAACLAFTAAILRLTRAPGLVAGWVWVALGLSGAAAILAGPIGLEFAIADVGVGVALLGLPGLRELARSGGRRLGLALLTLLTVAVVAVIYTHLAGFSPRFGISPIRHSLKGGVDQISPVLRDAVGTFGSLTIHLPDGAYWIWWLLVIGLVATALRVGTRRERLVVAAVAVLALAFLVLFWAWVDRYTGFGLQGHEVLPVLALIPLVAGEVVSRRMGLVAQRRTTTQRMLAGTIALIAVFQAYAWWYNARAAAGAPGTLTFYAHALWSPPLGWLTWIAVAGLGTAALLAFAATEAIDREGLRRPAPASG